MKKYFKEIDGKAVYKTRQRIVITKDGMQTFNPTEEMLIADGWVEYVKPEIIESTTEPVYEIEDMTVEKIKEMKKQQILQYDDLSDEINTFNIGEQKFWYDKNTRAGLMLRFQAEMSAGKTETSLWYNGNEFKMSIDKAIQIFQALEVYAAECYDTTQRHLRAIDELETLEEVEAYNYFGGYPASLYFE